MARNSGCDGEPCTCTGAQIWDGECLLGSGHGTGYPRGELGTWGEQLDQFGGDFD
jgi:hypothetical protein